MTSLSNKNAHGAVPRKSMADSDFLEAETIEVVPELPFQDDSDDGYSEFSEDDERADGIAEDEDEPFDEYGKFLHRWKKMGKILKNFYFVLLK